MADIVRWDPFREVVSLREAMDRLFNESFLRPWGIGWGLLPGEAWAVPLDMYETDTEVVVKASVPGIKPDDLQITVTDDVLTIKGELKAEQEIKRENYHMQEHRYGAFQRSIRLPVPVRSDKAEAVFEHGVLTLTLPKTEEVKPKQIKVKAK
jgi:HSP20 family protein